MVLEKPSMHFSIPHSLSTSGWLYVCTDRCLRLTSTCTQYAFLGHSKGVVWAPSMGPYLRWFIRAFYWAYKGSQIKAQYQIIKSVIINYRSLIYCHLHDMTERLHYSNTASWVEANTLISLYYLAWKFFLCITPRTEKMLCCPQRNRMHAWGAGI